MAKKTREQLKAASNSTYTTNGAKAITAAQVRTLNNDWLDSMESAYEVAQAGGYADTEAEFEAALARVAILKTNGAGAQFLGDDGQYRAVGGGGGSTAAWGATTNNQSPLTVDGIVKTVSLSGHTHNYAGSVSVGGAANSVAQSMIVKLNGGAVEGTSQFTFNGSAAKAVNITPALIGAPTTADLNNKVDKSGTDRLMTAAEGMKLSGIATGAQVNVIEGIQLNGVDLSVSNKKVNIVVSGGGDEPGAPGKSAYQSALDGGFTGTELEFNTSLASIGNINAVLDAINGQVI